MRDPYTVLGVAKTADAEVLRKAYKRLARENHPDCNPDPQSAERFKEVVEAYAILTNDRERARFVRQRRREHDEQEKRRQQQATEARRRRAEQTSATSAAAEEAFRAYARQVQERRQKQAASARAKSTASRKRSPERDTPLDHLGSLAAVLLMIIYLWRSWHGLPLFPILPMDSHATTHSLTSPIWITLCLSLLLILRPRVFLIPFIIEGTRDVRLFGWFLLLACPFVAAGALQRLIYL